MIDNSNHVNKIMTEENSTFLYIPLTRSGWTVPIAHLGQGICLTLRQLKGRNVTRIDLGFLDANSCCFRGKCETSAD